MCPFIGDKCQEDCQLYCPGEECCAIKLIALELIKNKGE